MVTAFKFQSDLHANLAWFDRNYTQATKKQSIVIDGGDPWAPYIGKDHPLRSGQQRGEETIDVMRKNAEKDPELLKKTIDAVLKRIPQVAARISALAICPNVNYRGIRGNAEQAWMKLAELAGRTDEMEEAFQFAYKLPQHWWMKDTDAEFFFKGKSVPLMNNLQNVDTAILYLPYQTPIETVSAAANKIHAVDPPYVQIVLHDRVTEKGVPDRYLDITRDGKTDDQVIEALDILANGRDVYCVHGHIGPHVPEFYHTFGHGSGTVHVYHIDESKGLLNDIAVW